MAGTDDGNDVQIARDDHSVQVRVDEVQARRRAPMAEQPGLDVLEGQRLGEQRIVEQIDLPDAKVVRRTPPGMHTLQLHLVQWAFGRFQLGGHCGFLGVRA